MKLNYHPETDSLYIDLSGRPSSESKEISEGIILDYDLNGSLVGIDIDNASDKVELKKLILINCLAQWKQLPPDHYLMNACKTWGQRRFIKTRFREVWRRRCNSVCLRSH